MGGKKKQAQRTKNNARPSSSGRSAQLLGETSRKLFSPFKDGDNPITVPNIADIELNLNQDFHLVIKKLNKRDPITRQKALLELADLCNTPDVTTIKTFLPLWPRLYNIHAVDTDYRVREAVQKAHRAIVATVKRDIAPYLKQVMGAWFVAAFDSHTLAANIAKTSFQIAFSPSKRTEAIIFAQHEILLHIAQNINDDLLETLGSSKNSSMDERHLNKLRIVSENLLAYGQYLDKLPRNQLMEAESENKRLILNSNKFWNWVKNETKSVKVAWFSMILVLMEKASFFLEDNQKRLCTAIFANLDIADSSILPIVWEAAIRNCSVVPNWWEYLNLDKFVLPKLWRVLQEAAFGNAVNTYPLVLRFLNNLVKSSVVKCDDFYPKLLSNLMRGFEALKGHRSATEVEAVVVTFFECFRFIIEYSREKTVVCSGLIQNYLVLLVENILRDDNLYEVISPIFVHLSDLLRYWHHVCDTTTAYNFILDLTWNFLRDLLSSSVSKTNFLATATDTNSISKDQLEKILRIHQKLIHALKNPTDTSLHQKTYTNQNYLIDEELNRIEFLKLKLMNNDQFVERLHLVVNDLIHVYYNMSLISEHSYLFVNQLCIILNLFNEKRYFERLTDILINSSSNEGDHNSSLNSTIRNWLNDNQVSVDAVLNVVFHLLVYIKDEEKLTILNNIREDHMSCVLELCLNLANDNQLQPAVRKWLSSSHFKKTLHSFASEVSSVWPPSLEKANILKACFRVPANEESYTSDETKIEILRVFRDTLLRNSMSENAISQQPHKDNLLCIVNVLEEIFKECNHSLLKKNHAIITDIIGYLFLYCCDLDNHVDNDDILNNAWMLGVRTLGKIFGYPSSDFINITEQFAFAVIELIEKSKCEFEDIKLIIDFVCKYIQCLPMPIETKLCANNKTEVQNEFNEEFSDFTTSTYNNVTSSICEVFLKVAVQYCHANMECIVVKACAKAEFYNGTITWRFPSFSQAGLDEFVFSSSSKVDDIDDSFSLVAKLFNVAFYIVTIIKNYLITSPNHEVQDNGENSNPVDHNNRPSLSRHALGQLNESIVYAIYILSVLKSFKENFTHARYYDYINESNLRELESITSEIVKMHPRDPMLLLKLALMNKAFQYGGFWAKALFLLFTELVDCADLTEAYNEILKCHEVSDHRKNSYLLHISELFATTAQIKAEFYSPDAKLDEEKLSILTCFLRANQNNRFSPDQDRIIWYWLDTILIHKKQLEATFNKNLKDCKPSNIILAATVCRFLSQVSDGKIPLMTDKRTDFMMIAVASWMQSIHKTCCTRAREDNAQFNMAICIFISAICDMFQSMTKLASNLNYSDKLFVEWNNVFAAETHTIISYTWKNLAESEGCRNVEQFLVLNTLSNLIITHVDFIQFVVRPDLNFWLCACSDLIQNYCTPVRLAAYHIFVELSLEMVAKDSCVSVVEDMEEKLTLEILSISSLQTVVGILLSSYKDGDNRILDPNADSYVYIHSYLLVWTVIIKLCENAPAHVRYRYASWLKETGYLEIFLHNLLMLMPEKIHKNNLSDTSIKKIQEFFSTNAFELNFEDRWDSQKLTLLVCRLFYMILWLLPAFVRQWWKNLEHKDSIVVDKLTTKFVSPTLIMEEMKAIKRGKPTDKFSMRGYPATRQIIATYTVEDSTMEIIMQLAVNHPLGIVKVDSNKTGVLPNKWKTWEKQLIMYLAHQNGLIHDGIISWKNNVDKAFEGVEECYICFSIVHSSNYQLPKKSCKTCQKKFHPVCLYRWFVTSNKSSCPICRNHF